MRAISMSDASAAIRDNLHRLRDWLGYGPEPKSAGALIWKREHDRFEVLLVTTRKSGRWVLPKGNIHPGETVAEAARREAYEEAGALLKAEVLDFGNVRMNKREGTSGNRLVDVAVHAFEIGTLVGQWPEAQQRTRMWVRPSVGADMVDDPEIRTMLRGLEEKLASIPRRAA